MEPIKPLTNREWEVVTHLLRGESNKQIAWSLNISIRTVEFHLKNIYAKYHVSSRIELVLKLGRATGQVELPRLGESTVAGPAGNAENGDRLMAKTGWAASFRVAVSMSGREPEMKSFFTTRHAAVGMAAAIFAGLLWIAFFRSVGNMAPDEIRAWIAPLILIWAIIGGAAGLVGRRYDSSVAKVGFCALAATGLSPLAILPLMGFVVMPLAKLLEKIGLINGETMPRDTATLLAIITMLAIWLILGVTSAIVLSSVALQKAAPKTPQGAES